MDPLLVRLGGAGSRELSVFLEDLINWNAGIRHYAAAALDYLQVKNFPDAAKCALKISPADGGRDKILQDVVDAWQSWYGGIEERYSTRREIVSRFEAAGCDGKSVSELDRTFVAVGARLQKLRGPSETKAQILGFVSRISGQDIRSVDDEVAYLELICEDCEKDIKARASQHDQQLAALRQQSAKIISSTLSEPRLDAGRRERALRLALQISAQLDRGDTASATQALNELGALTDPNFASAIATTVPQITKESGKAWELSARTKKELEQSTGRSLPDKFPEELEDPPGWEWNAERLEQARIFAHAYASAKESRYRDRALGPFLAIRAKQLLLNDNPDLALTFFREAYSWSVHAPTSLRAPARWRSDCAWGLLLSIILAFHSGNDIRVADRTRIIAPQNLEIVFHREIGSLPLALIEEMRLFSDVAHHVLALDMQSGESFIRDHLWEYLSARPIALQEFAEGLTLELPEEISKVLNNLCVLLDCSGDPAERDASMAIRPLIARAHSATGDEREVRYILDEVRNALRSRAEQSNLAESLIGGIEARSQVSAGAPDPRLTVRIITDQSGAGSSTRLALRISYGTGVHVLRGAQITARLETSQSKQIENAFETSSIPLGRLLPGEIREIGVPFRSGIQADQGGFAVVNMGRRDANNVLQNVELNGSRLRIPPLKAPWDKGAQRNPYVVGIALKSAGQIFGRDKEISDITRKLIGQTQDNVVLVLGERRIGKTTVLNGLRNNKEIRQRYIVTQTDMESAGNFADTAVFYNSYLMDPIRKCLLDARISVDDLHETGAASPHRGFENFMMQVEEKLKKENRRLLVILDELEKVFVEIERGLEGGGPGLPEEVVAALRAVIINSSQISFVLAGITDVVRRHLHTPKARLFNLALEVVLPTLPEKAAADLISRAVGESYMVTPRAEQQVILETNCHPYLLQKVCHELFEYMIDLGEGVATEADIGTVLDTKILPHGQPFAYLVETIRRPEDMVLIDALSFVQSGTRYVSVGELRRQLLRSGADYSEVEIRRRLDDLREQAPSLLGRAPNNAQRYRLSVPLFARHRRLRQLTHHSLVLTRGPTPAPISAE